jgi:radical SAM protein with 4Fe4S-binding SPASM domain
MALLDLWNDLTVPSDAVYFRDGERILGSNPELAAWALLEPAELDLLRRLADGGPAPSDRAAEIALARLVLNWLVYLPGKRPQVQEPNPVLKMVYYAITEGCNLRCPYCYASSEKCLPGELTTAEACGVMDQAAEMGADLVVLTGGEPMLRKDLFTVADHVRELGMRVNIITNGTLIRKPAVAQRVADTFDTVTVSMDGGTAELHEATRGKGTFARTVAALRMLNECGVRPMINHVVTERNVDHLPDLAELLTDIDVRQVRLMHHSELGRGASDTNSFGWQDYQKTHQFVWTHPGAKNLLPDGPLAQKPCTLRGNCGMGGTEIYVNSLGDVYPCKLVTAEQHCAGNVRRQTLPEIFDSEVLADLRGNSVFSGDNLADCRKCYIRGACGGGCRAYHQAQSGDVKRNARAFCRVLRHQMVTSMWAAVSKGRAVPMDHPDTAVEPRMVRGDGVHTVYLDWQSAPPPRATADLPVRRRLLPIVSTGA